MALEHFLPCPCGGIYDIMSLTHTVPDDDTLYKVPIGCKVDHLDFE
jgi:hypothetical protein